MESDFAFREAGLECVDFGRSPLRDRCDRRIGGLARGEFDLRHAAVNRLGAGPEIFAQPINLFGQGRAQPRLFRQAF